MILIDHCRCHMFTYTRAVGCYIAVKVLLPRAAYLLITAVRDTFQWLYLNTPVDGTSVSPLITKSRVPLWSLRTFPVCVDDEPDPAVRQSSARMASSRGPASKSPRSPAEQIRLGSFDK